LCRSLDRPVLLYSALAGRWRYSVMTDKLTTTMQIAERIYSLAQEQNDSGLMIGAYGYLACTLYLLGDFETARQYAKRGVEIWRSGAEQFPVEDWIAPAIHCLCYQALSEWHLGEVASCKVTIAEAISLAKQLHDTQASVFLLYWSAHLAYFQGNLTEMERLASELIEKSTRQNIATWLPHGRVLRGWARCASGDTTEGIAWIEDGIEDYRAAGAILAMPFFLALRAEAFYLSRNWRHNTLNANELYEKRLCHLRVAVPNASSWRGAGEER
jgi:tetratricopeptide (TPR) repeat protein